MKKRQNIQQNINVKDSQDVKIIQAGGEVQNFILPSRNTSKTKGIRKKVFISSTSFDLKDLRAELAKALKEWGYVPVWNESPDFPKKQGLHSHDVCLDVVKECDIYLLIIDKRYGGTYAGNKHPKEDISITWYETKIALQENKEIHTFVRDEVWNERPTYKKNLKEGVQIKPHHVDNPKVFDFIDFIVHLPRDNWIDTFKDSVALKEKLRIRLKGSTERKAPHPPHLTNITPPEPNFVGRQEMLDTITEWYKNPDVHIGALIGWGGEGKSAIVKKWYDSLEVNGVNPDGIFWWGFYRNPYLERLVDSLLGYLAAGRIDLEEIKSTWAKVDKIKELILEAEYLIILDGLEEMQKGEESGEEFGCMSHRELSEIFRFIADAKSMGLCLITSRYPLTDIKNWENKSYQKRDVERLSIENGRALFEKVGVKGSKKEIDSVIEGYNGHALSLTLLSKYLVEDFKGDIRKAKDIPPFHSDREAGGKAHRILLWYEKQLTEAQRSFMKIFSLFRREVHEKDFEGVFCSEMETSMNKVLREMSEFSFKRMVNNLYDRRLITKGQDETYATHPLIKNYFESIFEDEDKKLCHKRIYKYIDSYAPTLPDTLDEMQPLFEQVYHGCAAELYDFVYENIYQKKIQRLNEYYLVLKLGAWETDFDLVLNFFPLKDTSRIPLVSKRDIQIELISEAGTALLCIGKPIAAESLIMKVIEMSIENEDHKNASISYRTLAENQFRIGDIIKAQYSAKNAVKIAKKTHMPRQIVRSMCFFAYTLFLSGKIKVADKHFKEADILQREIDPNAGVLYSIDGIFYADFLYISERYDEAFKISTKNLGICTTKKKLIAEVSRCFRSLGTLERVKENHIKSNEHLNKALEIARKIGMPDLEIEAHIERGRLRLKTKDYNGAESDLKNVLKLCERTGFKLYEPDAEVVLAKVYLALGNIDKAKGFANSAYLKAKKIHYHWPKTEATELLEKISHRNAEAQREKEVIKSS